MTQEQKQERIVIAGLFLAAAIIWGFGTGLGALGIVAAVGIVALVWAISEISSPTIAITLVAVVAILLATKHFLGTPVLVLELIGIAGFIWRFLNRPEAKARRDMFVRRRENTRMWKLIFGNLRIWVTILGIIILIWLPLKWLLILGATTGVIIFLSSTRIEQVKEERRVKLPKEYKKGNPPPPTGPCRIYLLYIPIAEHPELCLWTPAILAGLFLAFKMESASIKILFEGPRIMSFPLFAMLLSLVFLFSLVMWGYFLLFVWNRHKTSVDTINKQVVVTVPEGWFKFGVWKATADIRTIKHIEGHPIVVAFFSQIVLWFWERWNPGYVFGSKKDEGGEQVESFGLPEWWHLWFEDYRSTLEN